MALKIVSVVCFLGVVIQLINTEKAPFITPCMTSDAECARENAVRVIPMMADGIPELGVEKMDPYFFKTVDSSISTRNVKFFLYDINLSGLKTCVPNKVQRNKARSSVFVQLTCDLKLDGRYDLAGEVLLLKVSGKGKIHVVLKKLVQDMEFDITELDGKDGEKHFHIQNYRYSYEFKEKSEVNFEGLFENNAVLSKATEELIKNNGNDIVREIGGPMFEICFKTVVKNLNNFFDRVPIKELSLD